MWRLSNRADPLAVRIADRHYNRQKVGSPQFVPPGRCIVLLNATNDALWVTSWPYAQYVKHAWAGAWVNSMFRNESPERASDLIRAAVAITKGFWNPPELGLISFIDTEWVNPTMRHGVKTWGYCYLKAGFYQIGETKGGLLAFQLLPHDMPDAIYPFGQQLSLEAVTTPPRGEAAF